MEKKLKNMKDREEVTVTEEKKIGQKRTMIVSK